MADKIPLSQIADVLGGFAFKSEDFNTDGIPVVRIADIQPPHVNLSESAKISETKVVGLDRFKLNDGDIVMAMTGATIGKAGRIRSSAPVYLNQRVAKISAKAGREFDDFVWAIVSRCGFEEEVLNNAGGSAQANVSAEGIGRIQIPDRSSDEQRAVGKVIRALDDKIDSNRQINRTLEDLATTLFRSWFVDFDPVVAKAAGRKPVHLRREVAALFSAHFQDSELGPIPYGWEAKSVEDLAQYVNGRAFTKGASGKGRMVIRIAELNSGPGGSTIYSDINVAPEHVAQPGDLLFAWSGSLDVYRWYRDEAIINQHIFKVVCQKYPQWFVHQQLREAMPFFQDIAADKATTMGHIKREHLSQALLAVPPKELLDAAHKIFQPLYDRQLANERESLTLAALRDTLLPKLLAGELRVRDADRVSEKA